MDCIKNNKEYFINTKGNKKIPVRKLQLEVLSIMDAIDDVCKKNDIKYAHNYTNQPISNLINLPLQ